MKKLIIIYTLILFGLVDAQSVKYGVTGDLHKSSIVGVHGISKGNFGGSLGVFADFSLVTNDIYDSAWLYFTPQLEFFTIGERGDWNEDEKDYQKYNNYYIGLPLYIKYFLKNHGYKSDIYFMAGPKLEFLVSENTDEGNAVKEAQLGGYDPNKYGLNQEAKKFGFGISLKTGVRVNEKLDVFIRFDRGFSKVYSDYTRNTTYNRFLAIGVSYYLGETNY